MSKSRKELKAAYKESKPVMGVFQLKNNITGKVLIEACRDINARWNRHQMELKFNSHRNKVLQKDWNEYSANNFSFEILSELEYKEEGNINYSKELKVLKELVLEELNYSNDLSY